MKKLSFLAVMALLMMFGCSKEEMTNTEQELFSVEKNDQTVIGEKRGDGGVNAWNFVEFFGTSTVGPDTPLIICLPDDVAEPLGLPGMNCGRKLLSNGYFSGNLPGYGKIISSLSTYTIEFGEPYWDYFELYQNAEHYALYDDPSIPARFEKYLYNIVIKGKVATSNKDYFNITVIAVIRPMINDETGDIIRGSWILASDIDFAPGDGKLANYSDEYFTCGTRQIEGTNYSGVNLKTGEMSLVLKKVQW